MGRGVQPPAECGVGVRRRWPAVRTPVAVSAAATAAGLVCAACAGSIFASPANGSDTALAAFGRDNPQCLLWTDWKRLCSRTGPGRTLYCRTDPGRNVEPSEPFCAAARGPTNDAHLENFGRLRRTSTRFCEVPTEDAADAQREGEPDLCDRYRADRPFNGRRLSALRHPWCETWADSETQKPVCSESGGGPGRSCASLASAGYQHDRLLICSAWRPGIPCRRPFAGASLRSSQSGIEVGPVPSAEGSAAFGTICLD